MIFKADNTMYMLQYNTIQYNTVQYNTIQYNTVKYRITRHPMKCRSQIYNTS